MPVTMQENLCEVLMSLLSQRSLRPKTESVDLGSWTITVAPGLVARVFVNAL